MQKTIKYTIFKTKWGYFGFAADDNGLLRTVLPLANRKRIKSKLLQNFPNSRYEKGLFKSAQQQIIAYFEGACADFRNLPVVLNGSGIFTRRVLNACRDIKFGRTATYGRLAKLAGNPAAARAIGLVMAKNPLPLIIPCHRVIRADGSLAGFSAPGGINLKKRLLELEASCRC